MQQATASVERRMSMNEDILKGKWLEIKGSVKEKWGKLTDNDIGESEGKGEKLLGLLQNRYGYIKYKADPQYKDTVDLAVIIGNIREIMIKKDDIKMIAGIARYGQPLLAKSRGRQIAGPFLKIEG
jgi:uncharacterized protein YjbJ (UPF0337 family)